MPIDWAGANILQAQTSIPSKRRVLGHADTLVPTDLREWVTAGGSEEIERVISDLRETRSLPRSKKRGSFDERAKIIWGWVTQEIRYVEDRISHKHADFWQFPAETIALKQGDCEDCSFLLASLLLSSGISPFCVRVVFGTVKVSDKAPAGGHAWPVYKDETGCWRILETTDSSEEASWRPADDFIKPGSRPLYKPDMCINRQHVWQVGRAAIGNVAQYVADWESRRLPSRQPG